MYDNIGQKIKGLAKAIFIIEAILFIFIGIALMIAPGGFLVGLLVVVGGFLCSWISSWLLYGFGEIIDLLQENKAKTTALYNAYCQNHTTEAYKAVAKIQKMVAEETEAKPEKNPTATIKCPSCGFEQKNDRTLCWKCGPHL